MCRGGWFIGHAGMRCSGGGEGGARARIDFEVHCGCRCSLAGGLAGFW